MIIPVWLIFFLSIPHLMKRFKVDMSEFPTISRINEELIKHEAFIEASPSKQPDCPEELR